MTAKHISLRRRYAAFLAALMRGGNTTYELAEKTGMDYETVRPFINELHTAGLVHIIGWRRTGKVGKPSAVWVLGEGADVPRPTPRTSRQRQRDLLARKTDKPLSKAPTAVRAPSSVFDLGRFL